jgi:hypothetical protein
MTLGVEYLNHSGRVADKWKRYFPAYETHLRRYVNRPLTFLEIGVGGGGALQLWKRFFGPHGGVRARAHGAQDRVSHRSGR